MDLGVFLFTLPGVVYLRSKHPCFLQPGLFKEVKGLGWYLEEHDVAQVSLNLCDFNITSLHTVYEECCKIAKVRSVSLLHMLIWNVSKKLNPVGITFSRLDELHSDIEVVAHSKV